MSNDRAISLVDTGATFGLFPEGPPAPCIWRPVMAELEIREPRPQDYPTVTRDLAGRVCLLHDPNHQKMLVVGLKFCGLDRLSGEQWGRLLGAQNERGELPLRRVLEVMQAASIFIECEGVRNWFTSAFLWVGREENVGRAPMIPQEVWEAARIHPR